MAALRPTTARITAASITAPVASDNVAAPASRSTGVEHTWSRRISSVLLGRGAGSALAPNRSRRCSACSDDRPVALSVAQRSSAAAAVEACQATAAPLAVSAFWPLRGALA